LGESWATQELRWAEFGDKRLRDRLIRIVEDLAASPTASVPEACGQWPATKATYRFWDSGRVTPAAIRAGHREATVGRMQSEGLVLAIQDTTDLDFTHHPATEGLGPLDHPALSGLKVHSVLAVSEAGVPLGLVHQAVWARDPEQVGKRHQRRQRETKDKESQRWLTALQASEAAVPEARTVVTVADREADIYDLFALPRRLGSELLIRAEHNRRVNDEGYLWETVQQAPVAGQYTFTVQRKEDVPARQATLNVRFTPVMVQPPRNRRGRRALRAVPITLVLAQEEAAPSDVTPVQWLLLTTLAVTTFDDALRCVRWYSYRWLIERYHFVLKSGCNVEELQLATAERLESALATYCIVAWRLLWLTYEARRSPEASCSSVLETHEWQALYCTIHQTPVPPAEPPTLQQAVRWIAQLGGFLGRKSDGQPGVKTIWRGLRHLHDIAATWQLLHPSSPSQLNTTYG
jgi:hypothetical protein